MTVFQGDWAQIESLVTTEMTTFSVEMALMSSLLGMATIESLVRQEETVSLAALTVTTSMVVMAMTN